MALTKQEKNGLASRIRFLKGAGCTKEDALERLSNLGYKRQTIGKYWEAIRS